MTIIEEIRKRLSEATPGPFNSNEFGPKYPGVWTKGGMILMQKNQGDEATAKDYEMFANAPSDLEYLLAELKKRDVMIAQSVDFDIHNDKVKGLKAELEKMAGFVGWFASTDHTEQCEKVNGMMLCNCGVSIARDLILVYRGEP